MSELSSKLFETADAIMNGAERINTYWGPKNVSGVEAMINGVLLKHESDRILIAKTFDICPECKSTNVNTEEIEAGDGVAVEDVSCRDCKATWAQTYRAEAIINIEVNTIDSE